MEKLLPIFGVIIIAAIVCFLVKSSAIWTEYIQQEGIDVNDVSEDNIPDGFYMDEQGVLQIVPLGAIATPDKRGFLPIVETTVAGSIIPVSTSPDIDDLIHYDTNNFDTTYHSVDPSQYFNVKAIDKDGNIDLSQLHDLFPEVKLNDPPYMPTYSDSVLFSALNREHIPLTHYTKPKSINPFMEYKPI